MYVGFVGVGKLGSALIKGLVNKGYPSSNIYIYDKSSLGVYKIEKLGVNICKDIKELIDRSDIIIISVRPQDIHSLSNQLRTISIGSEKILISTIALVPLWFLEKVIKGGVIYRAMPNIAAEVNSSFTAVSPQDKRNEKIDELFSYLGVVEWVDEEVLDSLTLMSASIPALVIEIIDTFILASLKAGIPIDIAKKSIITVLRGVTSLYEIKELSTIRNSIITPKGITVNLIENFYSYEVKSRLLTSIVSTYSEFQEKMERFRENLKK